MIDSHFHYDDSIISATDLIASMDKAGIWKIALIPALSPDVSLPYLGKFIMPLFRVWLRGQNPLLHPLALYLYGNSVKPDGSVNLLGNRYKLVTQPDNAGLKTVLDEYPDRFYGYVFVNPTGPNDPIREIEKYRKTPGIIGVKAHPFWHDYDISKLEPVAEYCVQHNLVLLIHLGVARKGDFALLPKQFPKLKVIYAHCGVPYIRQLCEFAKDWPNIYVDLSSSGYVNEPTARMAIDCLGIDRCLFGTDGPYFHIHNHRFDFQYYLNMIFRLGLSETDIEKVTRDNFLRLIET